MTSGLNDLGNGCYAYLQLNPGWGWNNSGLVTDGKRSLLIDTLFDLTLTARMLSVMREAVPAARQIDWVLNTHANGDHCFGNQLVADAEIIASRRASLELFDLPPKKVALLLRSTWAVKRFGSPAKAATALLGRLGLEMAANIGEAAEFIQDIFGHFELEGIELAPPTRTFEGELRLEVGELEAQLIEVGPAHSGGDVIAFIPSARTVYAGDMLFIGSHPLLWDGPLKNCIRVCDLINEMKPDIIVPGHGPLTDLRGVERFRDFLNFLFDETSERYEQGMSAWEAAFDLSFSDFEPLTEEERIIVNVETIYRELSGDTRKPDGTESFAKMAAFKKEYCGIS